MAAAVIIVVVADFFLGGKLELEQPGNMALNWPCMHEHAGSDAGSEELLRADVRKLCMNSNLKYKCKH